MTTKLQTACVDALKLALIGDSVVDEVGPASPAVRAARRHVNACPACASALDDSAVATRCRDVAARLADADGLELACDEVEAAWPAQRRASYS